MRIEQVDIRIHLTGQIDTLSYPPHSAVWMVASLNLSVTKSLCGEDTSTPLTLKLATI